MGKLAVYKYFSFMFLIITLLVSGFTFFGLFGGDSNPVGNTAMAMLVYALPIFIAANGIMLIYWLIRRRWHWSLIPLITILCCIPYIGTMVHPAFLTTGEESRSGIKIATYNVAMFGRETSGFKAEDILSEMKRHNVDVLCMQEYNDVSGDRKNSESYRSYFNFMAKGEDDMVIYSRFPITESKNMHFEYTNNSAMWVTIEVNGKELRIFNVHLETTGFNRTMRQAGRMAAYGVQPESNALLKAIYGNYMLGLVIRSGQARLVAQEIHNSDAPVIVCGDFNDVPYSYVYNTMKGYLVDGFRECGKSWWMSTYRGNKFFRIDYIFHDKSLKGETYYTDNISYSDHLPVFMKLSL